jgi:predicted DNA-binding protein (MmcQ/YjbR family)
MDTMSRLEALVATLPEAERVDVAEWGDHPTFRVRGKNFVFAAGDASSLSVKLPKDEAEAVVATEEFAAPTAYGLGRHGWVSLQVGADVDDERWAQLAEWIETSYRLIAPKRLVKLLDERET